MLVKSLARLSDKSERERQTQERNKLITVARRGRGLWWPDFMLRSIGRVVKCVSLDRWSRDHRSIVNWRRSVQSALLSRRILYRIHSSTVWLNCRAETHIVSMSRPRLPRADLVWWGVCVWKQSVYFVKCFITNNTKAVKETTIQ